jgi:hypothetical protein
MDMEDVMENIRADLRERPDSHFSEIYVRSVERGASGATVRRALSGMLQRDEIRITDGKWRLIAPVQRRKSA